MEADGVRGEPCLPPPSQGLEANLVHDLEALNAIPNVPSPIWPFDPPLTAAPLCHLVPTSQLWRIYGGTWKAGYVFDDSSLFFHSTRLIRGSNPFICLSFQMPSSNISWTRYWQFQLTQNLQPNGREKFKMSLPFLCRSTSRLHLILSPFFVLAPRKTKSRPPVVESELASHSVIRADFIYVRSDEIGCWGHSQSFFSCHKMFIWISLCQSPWTNFSNNDKWQRCISRTINIAPKQNYNLLWNVFRQRN